MSRGEHKKSLVMIQVKLKGIVFGYVSFLVKTVDQIKDWDRAEQRALKFTVSKLDISKNE